MSKNKTGDMVLSNNRKNARSPGNRASVGKRKKNIAAYNTEKDKSIDRAILPFNRLPIINSRAPTNTRGPIETGACSQAILNNSTLKSLRLLDNRIELRSKPQIK